MDPKILYGYNNQNAVDSIFPIDEPKRAVLALGPKMKPCYGGKNRAFDKNFFSHGIAFAVLHGIVRYVVRYSIVVGHGIS